MAVPPEGDVQPTAAGRKANVDKEGKEDEQVEKKEEEQDKVATSESSDKKTEEPTKPSLPVWGNPPAVMCFVLIAVVFAVMQNEYVMSGRAMDLFEPHVVSPPEAGNREVVIQFCQS